MDVCARSGPTYELDIAAGQAIVEAAGGVVNQADTWEPLRYNKENLLNPSFVGGSSEPPREIPRTRD